MTDRPAASAPSPARRPADRLRLSPRHRAQLEALLREHLPDVEVWAYGSRITGASHDGSDLDLVLRAPDLQKIPIGRLSDLWEALRESTIPFLVEARDWARLPEEFHGEIERDYVVLLEGARAAGSTVGREWGNSTIGEIAEVFGGGTPSTKDLGNFGGDVPWITPKDLSGSPGRYVSRGARNLSKKGLDSSAARLLPAGTVLLSTRAPIGYVAIAASPVTTNQGFRNLVLKDGFLPDFYYYWLTNNVPELERHASGSTFKEISGTAVKQIDIPVPPFSEQRAIAHVLGALDDKIELNRRMNETLEAIARALFKSWFVDFDPVRAKMEGRDTGLPADVADLFPSRLVDAELGTIPEGWESVRLDSVANLTKGRSYRRAELATSDTALVTLKSFVRGGGYRPEGMKPFRGVYKSEQMVQPGEVIVACTDVTQLAEVVGRSAIVEPTSSFQTLVASLDILIVRPKNASAGRAFLYYLTKTPSFVTHAVARTTGTTVLHLSPDAVASFRFALPPQSLVERFEYWSDSLRARIHVNASTVASLTNLQATLLPKLVSGELPVPLAVRQRGEQDG